MGPTGAGPGCSGGPPGRWDAAVGVLIRTGGRGRQILLVRRADREGDPWSGQVALPGGMRMEGEAHPAETAAREVREEVGIDPAGSARRCEVLPPVRSRAAGLVVVPVLMEGDFGDPSPDGREISEAAWISLEDLEHCFASIGGAQVPALRAGTMVVWGLTYRVILRVLEKVG